jgi:hypothetical protein
MAYAKLCRRLGDSGAGQLTKMVNQICIAGLVQGLSEGLHFAEKAGLDGREVVEVIKGGAAGSWQMANRYETMLDDHFAHGFAVDWMRKDLGICLATANETGASLPVTALVDQFYKDVQKMGGGRWDTSSLIARLRALWVRQEGLRPPSPSAASPHGWTAKKKRGASGARQPRRPEPEAPSGRGPRAAFHDAIERLRSSQATSSQRTSGAALIWASKLVHRDVRRPDRRCRRRAPPTSRVRPQYGRCRHLPVARRRERAEEGQRAPRRRTRARRPTGTAAM